MTSIKEVFKNLSNNRKVFLFAVISAFSVFLIVSIQKVYAYYHDSFLSSILANKVGDFDLGDGDMNMMIYRENDEGEYIRVYAIPASYYVFDDSQTSCSIPCNDGTGNCEYSFDTTNRAFSLTSSQKVTCKFYFKQEGPTDIKVNMLIEDASANDTYTYNSKTYRLSDNIPAYGYKYSEHYTCDNGATLTYNAETKKVNVSSTSKTTCYVYFDQVGDPDIIVNTYVQEELNGTTYTKVNSIPSNKTYALNSDKSVCTPVNSGGVAGTITYSGGYINVEANGPQECEVYLDLVEANPLGQYIIDNSISGLEKSKVTGDTLYRFSGTTGNTGINNYICLGTTSKCASGSDEMYRIIGVEPDTGYVKVIKQIKYGDISWDSSTGVTWPSSGAYSTMTTWYNSVSFKSMIVSHSWNIGDFTSGPTTRANALSADTGNTTTANVGMLAVSDYYLAYKGDQNWNSSYSNYTSNWIHLANNGNTIDAEWTMSRYNSSRAWRVGNDGAVYDANMTVSIAVRPVFYLNSTVNRISGSGTSGDPFIVG